MIIWGETRVKEVEVLFVIITTLKTFFKRQNLEV